MSHPENTCIECHSPKIEFNQNYGFYKCLNCGHLWGYDQDDPDYEESLSCPDCASKRTYQVDGRLVEDVGNDDFRLGTKYHCVGCGHDWEEWE
jgi:DNA-directed RNA polymerase subunit RPC12/RpoP